MSGGIESRVEGGPVAGEANAGRHTCCTVSKQVQRDERLHVCIMCESNLISAVVSDAKRKAVEGTRVGGRSRQAANFQLG